MHTLGVLWAEAPELAGVRIAQEDLEPGVDEEASKFDV